MLLDREIAFACACVRAGADVLCICVCVRRECAYAQGGKSDYSHFYDMEDFRSACVPLCVRARALVCVCSVVCVCVCHVRAVWVAYPLSDLCVYCTWSRGHPNDDGEGVPAGGGRQRSDGGPCLLSRLLALVLFLQSALICLVFPWLFLVVTHSVSPLCSSRSPWSRQRARIARLALMNGNDGRALVVRSCVCSCSC